MTKQLFGDDTPPISTFRTFIAFDVETTGLYPDSDTIIELGATLFRNGEPAETFNRFVDPGIPIPAHITRLTGITDADCQGQPGPAETARDFMTFAGTLPLIAHNADFDRRFVEAAAGTKLENPIFDTLIMSRIHLPELPNHRLQTIAAHCGQTGQFHRASDDARITGSIFLTLLDKLESSPAETVNLAAAFLADAPSDLKLMYRPVADDAGTELPQAGPGETLSAAGLLLAAEEQMDLELERRPLNADTTAAVFSRNGLLAGQLANFEYREPQERMVHAVTRAFNDDEFALIEAGTGTGKSLAYLVPAIKWAVQNGSRVVISTNTKNLQEQLYFKDIPFLKKTLGHEFKAALLKGRSNYLCLHKWESAVTETNFRFGKRERLGLLPLVSWVRQTKTGDIAENAGFNVNMNRDLWSKVCAEVHYCRGPRCAHYGQCYLMRARMTAMRSHIVVINHSLLFSDLVTDATILGPYEYLVIDEAHNTEKTALNYFGNDFNIWKVRGTLHAVYDTNGTGLVNQLSKMINKAGKGGGELKSAQNQAERVLDDLKSFTKETDRFFTDLTAAARQQAGREMKFRYTAGHTFLMTNEGLLEDFSDRMRSVRFGIYTLSELLIDVPAGSFGKQEELIDQLQARVRDWDDLNGLFTALIDPEQERTVFWAEPARKPKSNDTRLCSAPLDIAEKLNANLYNRMRSIIFTSATMAVARSFKYIRERIGLDIEYGERVSETLLDSPFDFDSQSITLVPSCLPVPKDPSFQDLQTGLLTGLIRHAERGTLILYTSYSAMNKAGNALKSALLGEDKTILVQGQDGSRSAIVTQFREDTHSVLLGTDSFWEGVDVPGEALELLVIARLPFAVPSEPVVAAQMEEIEKAGKNPFMDYSVPEAVIKFRQGCGRLIRSRRDRGVILILDPRVISTRYGKMFLQSIPGTARSVATENELLSLIRSW